MSHDPQRTPFRLAILGLAVIACLVLSPTAGQAQEDFWLTVLHHNDGESQLIDGGSGRTDYGGVARFATRVNQIRSDALAAGDAVLLLEAGDTFLAGPELEASFSTPGVVYDALALDLIGYDAMAIGNHEFDFGPGFLAEFISAFTTTQVPFLSANLDFTGEPELQALVDVGRIAKSVVLERNGRQIGIVGATTDNLANISSPRNVVVNPVVPAVQAEIDALTAQGVDIIIFISHLQSLKEDTATVGQLRGFDLAIGGGSDALLANQGATLVPGDEDDVEGPYPMMVQDADGRMIPLVTAPGDYLYIGRVRARFDADGNLLEVDTGSNPERISGVGDDAVTADPTVQQQVVDPVAAFVADLQATQVAVSEVALEGRRPQIRVQETNLGNLLADAVRWQATRLAADFGAPVPDIGIQNGGSIRNSSLIPAGPLTEFDTFSIAPFSNFVVVVPDIGPARLKELLENAVSNVEAVDGRWAHLSGITVEFDPTRRAQRVDDDENVITPGERIRSATLEDGRKIVENGAVVADAPSVNIATVDFLARGGDSYPYRGAPFVVLGSSYQQALRSYIVDGLDGQVTAADYPEGGEGRVVNLNSFCLDDPTTVCLNRGRFRVRVEWTDYQSTQGVGHVGPMRTDASGVFWFFGPENWEMLVKVLDGCAVNGHFWVLGAPATDVGYRLFVTDTQTDDVMSYTNPLGTTPNAIIDTQAFATCP